MSDVGRIKLEHARRLEDPRRLQTQVSEEELGRLLTLRGHEDLLDLGSGTGFYTDRMAALTTGSVYAVELQPQMHEYYRQRGVPANVRLIAGDITALPVGPADTAGTDAARARLGPPASSASLSLRPGSVDVACSISTWHEIEGRLDLRGLNAIVRPGGRLLVIDWRRDPESTESGPPQHIRSTKDEVAQALVPFFVTVAAEDLGRFMFAVTARREDLPG